MADGIESDGRSADGDLALFDEPGYDPEFGSDDSTKLSPVWTSSDNLRKLLRSQRDPGPEDRALKTALTIQVPNLVLYWQMGLFLKAQKDRSASPKALHLYILLFPGEGRDNTGIKDLNDKVIGQWWTGEFIRQRYAAIERIFQSTSTTWLVASQTYKTAYLLTYDATRKEFVEKLAKLDAELCTILLTILKAAEEDASDKQRKEIKTLRKKLKKKKYRFDLYFGLRILKPGRGSKLQNVYLLVTEALKGAAMARFVAKTASLRSSVAKKVAKGKISADARKLDPRGKEYNWDVYIKASDLAEKIKALFVAGYTQDNPLVLNEIYIDTVWTWAFLQHKKLYWGNPDTIRDVRKKKLESAPLRKGNMTYSFPAQKELLELWLIILNMVDYVKRFKTDEFAGKLQSYHDDALEVFTQLGSASTDDIDWPKLESILTQDVRRHKPLAVYETASEFQFFSFAADHTQRIFFSMDIRDMGVELMLHYEHSNREIGYHRHSDLELMKETFRASDAIDERRRVTYDRVVEVFKKYYDLLAANPAAAQPKAKAAFGVKTFDKLGSFAESVQIMLGGDEVYAAAHPLYAHYVHNIVSEIDKTAYNKKGTLNMRAAVVFSSGKKTEPAQQRLAIQLAHQEAMKLAEVAPSTLKELERTHRRIQRLIEMLEANDKKKDKAPPYRKALDQLPLTRLFARAKHGWPELLKSRDFTNLLTAMKISLAAAKITKKFDVVDFNGNVVDDEKLVKDAAALEDRVRRDVGIDNVRQHPPPVNKLPKEPGWLEDLLDIWN